MRPWRVPGLLDSEQSFASSQVESLWPALIMARTPMWVVEKPVSVTTRHDGKVSDTPESLAWKAVMM